MEHNDQLHVEAEEALANINKKTGRNMPQAVATARCSSSSYWRAC